jgi:hypothetical protein
MIGTPDQIFAARGAWLAAMASHEVNRLEVIKRWLEYLELADPVRAPNIRKILERAWKGAAKTADELFPAAVSLGQSIPRPQELRHAAPRNQPRTASTPLRGAEQNRPVE